MPAEQHFEHVAAVDLGSNSFHMVVARLESGELKVLDRIRESVRLAAGLTPERTLDEPACERALGCLARFGQRLAGFPSGSVRAVGTNTLRKARNAAEILPAAREALGHEIEVVSGYEEARLVYLGVAHSVSDDGGRRLVVDIGGGSTEVIAGEGFEPVHLESLFMGCVSLTQEFFADGAITKKRMRAAELAARRQLEPVAGEFLRYGWRRAIGSSGTIRSIERVVQLAGWSALGVTPASLRRLRETMLAAGSIEALDLKGLSGRRAEILPGGFAALAGVFEALGIDCMEAADGALREGLLLDLLGRLSHEDIRERTVAAMASRYHVDAGQAERVRETALELLAQAAPRWNLDVAASGQLLGWAAALHEMGLDIAHNHYHKHGGYIAAHADMAGFSRQEQAMLAALIRAHRRKLAISAFEALPAVRVANTSRLAILLRLAVVLHRGRTAAPVEAIELEVEGKTLAVSLAAGWRERQPLLAADLSEEAGFLRAAGFCLRVR